MNRDRPDKTAPDWAELNAYVDGELDGAAAARVAAAVARDAGLAREVARLARLKSTVQASAPAAPRLQVPQTRRRWRAGLAASFLLLALLGGALALAPQRVGDTVAPPVPEALARAEGLHAGWLSEPVRTDSPEAGLLLASLQRFGLPVQIPDLSDTRLRVTHVALLGEAGEVLHVGYHGTRGCRVSLLALRDRNLPERLQRLPRPGGLAYLWRAGPVGYVLLADGMDPERMETIAGAIEQATRRLAPLPAETRTALAESRARSQPCLG